MQFIIKLANSPVVGQDQGSTATQPTVSVVVPGIHSPERSFSPCSETSGRKRQRLDHLSSEEKLFRRKLKNRVAAQTARDKKKARMDELEAIVEQLRLENEKLKRENQRLQKENSILKVTNQQDAPQSHSTEVPEPLESAELINGPQQQEQGRGSTVAVRWSALCVLLWILQLEKIARSSKSWEKKFKLTMSQTQAPSATLLKKLSLRRHLWTSARNHPRRPP